MLIEPTFPDNPMDLIKTAKNKKFAEYLQGEGMEASKISEILVTFFSWKVICKDIMDHVTNPEWVEVRAYRKKIANQYEKAVGALEKLMSDESIPAGTRRTIIQKDIDTLQSHVDFITMEAHLTPGINPRPLSTQQMLNMQAWGLFQYLKKFTTYRPDNDIYDFIAELFKNLYADTALREDMKKLTGEILKKNFVDNMDKLTAKKYAELQRKINLIIS